MFTFNMRGIEGTRNLTEFQFRTVVNSWAETVEPMLLDAIRRNAPVSKGARGGSTSGYLRVRDSFAAHRFPTADGVNINFTSSAPQTRFVLRGTRPHEIRPRQARALYWTDKGGGHFARLVHHPGTRPNPFVRRAIQPLLPLVRARFRDEVAKAVGGR